MNPHPLRPHTIALALLAAAVGGCVGFYAFFWIASQGLYAIILPPALVGLFAGYCMPRRSQGVAVICGVAGLAVGLLTEWKFAPFNVDDSWTYFITHVHQLRQMTLLLIAIGTVASYRFALGRDSVANDDSVRADDQP